jgi:FtsP/CotA-like multicopper oxidase with cupredoxin domain
VTEEVGTLGTIAIAWSPDRPGNWLLHCHKPFHSAAERSEDAYGIAPTHSSHDGENHALTGMGGLVMGITVKPAPSVKLAGAPRSATANRMRLLVHRHEHYYGAEPAYGFVLQQGASPLRDSVLVPGPILTLTRGPRTEIAVVNESDVATSVHWHGIELESYFDGVSGWSGTDARPAPRIAPGDSFVASFTPPRAGTFIYHTHMNDMRQLAAGLYGGLVVLEPGQHWSDTTDHLYAIGQAGFDSPAWTILNGRPTSETVVWKKGLTHRLRFLSMTIDQESDVEIARDSGVATWTPIARDGTPLPPALVVAQPARLHIGPGQTNDFEFRPEPGTYHLRLAALTNVLVTIVVR